MRRILVLSTLLAMAGCATGPNLQSRMASYIGASGETLVRDMGVPDKQITLKNVQYLAYVRQQTEISPDPGLFFGYGGYGGFYGPVPGPFAGGYYGAVVAPQTVVWRCETTFTLQSDKVVGFALRGNDCS